MNNLENINRAKQILKESDAILITAGAGIGVDSGLPDFRGIDGFWKAYPKAKELRVNFEEMANPKQFKENPQMAWAFYGHRLHLYRDTVPHNGFTKLLKLANSKKYGAFIFTSNVDGQFQKAGFKENQIMECHGSIHQMQCVNNCTKNIWSAKSTFIEIEDGFKAKTPLPKCLYCEHIARPNILMFDDFLWEHKRTTKQRENIVNWIDRVEQDNAKLAIVELGAGTVVPTVRNTSKQMAKRFLVPLIRINPRESHDAEISLKMGALEALNKIIP